MLSERYILFSQTMVFGCVNRIYLSHHPYLFCCHCPPGIVSTISFQQKIVLIILLTTILFGNRVGGVQRVNIIEFGFENRAFKF